jgi:putative pyruvate formate lyase activating enzyme
MKCNLCPRKCNVDRSKERGFCNMGDKMKVARYSLHMWEEPCISGDKGSGTIFFVGCNLKCIYCQNYKLIDNDNIGREVSIDEFSDICLELQEKGAYNINIVTGTHFIPLIRDGIVKSRENGLSIPIVYNTSSYENVDALKELDGLVDIYLPDLKYYDDKIASKYSMCNNYFEYATKAIDEMYRQVGKYKIKNGIMTKGVIVRHLMLPGHLEDSKKIIKYLYDKYKDNIYISIMNQYTPVNKTKYDNLNHKVDDKDYDELINYALDIGVKNAFIQEGETQSESFIPDFNIFNAT